VTRVRAAGRIVALAAVLLFAGLALAASRLLAPTRRPSVVRALSRAALAALGVRHQRTGPLPRRRALVVAHHVSWLDVLVILAHMPARLLAKRQVRSWPVIGVLAAATGTLFIDRTRPRALPATVAEIAAALRSDAVVAAFPEGTTRCGRVGGRFRPAVFQAAVDTGAPVTPVSLRFRLADGSATTIAAYLDQDTLLASIARVAATDGLRVALRAHTALHPTTEATRRILARAAQAATT
jgi:1-acyl-sn-glycerol-3-phosphate acyltransferase